MLLSILVNASKSLAMHVPQGVISYTAHHAAVPGTPIEQAVAP